MPRTKKNPVHRYFQYLDEESKSQCTICGIKIKGNHVTNLKNHLINKHLEQYNEIHILQESQKENASETPSKKSKLDKLTKLQNACMRLVAIHGRPLALIDDEAFQQIIDLVFDESSKTNSNIINSSKTRELLTDTAYQIKRKISSLIKGKMISLKLDSATCLDRNFIGINMQYVEGNKIVVRTLAVAEMFERQTAQNLKSRLLRTLVEYNITTKQIYSVTTDNGANYIKMKELLNEEDCTDEFEVNFGDAERSDVELECDLDFSLQGLSNMEENLFNDMPEFASAFEIRSISCAQHTLQLAIKDGLKQEEFAQNTIEIARSAVKILRKPSNKNNLRKSNKPMPILDCATRWNSTYNMLLRLLTLQEVCMSNDDVSQIIDDHTWLHISEIITSLEPAYEATLRLQKEQLCLSDFYVVWLILKNKLEQSATALSKSILKALKERELGLLNNKAFLSAIFMDPRLNLILSDQEALSAIAYLKETYRQIVIIEKESAEVANQENVEGCSTSGTLNSQIQNDLMDLEQVLQNTERIRNDNPEVRDNLDLLLNEIRAGKRLSLSANILDHWCGKSNTIPKASKLAMVVLGVPATQVTVERLFSTLKFVLSPLRYNLLDGLVDDILVLRHNKDLL